MSFTFSVVILAYNEEKTIGKCIERIIAYTYRSPFTVEIIIIDSGSTDRTLPIIRKLQAKYSHIKLKRIWKEQFHYAKTRNLGVKLSKGKYILFISADAVPITPNMFYRFKTILDKKKVVAVFGKHIPFSLVDFSPMTIEAMCRFRVLDKYVDRDGLLYFDSQKPFIPYEENRYLWFSLFNTYACYRKSFLMTCKFNESIPIYEDAFLGKTIIENDLVKVYDNKNIVRHEHNLSLIEYIKEQKIYFRMKYKFFEAKKSVNIMCKFNLILRLKGDVRQKAFFIAQIVLLYVIKLFLYFCMRLEKARNSLS